MGLQDEETVLLQGEKEAEKMIIEAYSALLLAFLSTERYYAGDAPFRILLYFHENYHTPHSFLIEMPFI